MPFTSSIGVCEAEGSLSEALQNVGKQDTDGGVVAVHYIKSTGLRLIPLVVRAGVFLLLIGVYFVRQPFGWIPVSSGFLGELSAWEGVSLFSWLVAILLYSGYFAVTLWKDGIFVGRPGTDIHFTMHNRIVKTLKPGQRTVILDPRVTPFAAVSTSPIVLLMDPVEGVSSDSITHTFRGALVVKVSDSFRLIEQGGFSKFVRQLEEQYEALVRDKILKGKAGEFNRFMNQPVGIPAYVGVAAGGMNAQLSKLGYSELGVGLIEDAATIGELAVSEIGLSESSSVERLSIIAALQRLAEAYGLSVIDHIPVGNTVADDYLKALAKTTISDLMRLDQAAKRLLAITEEEIQEEIASAVATKKLGVLRVEQVIREIRAITSSLLKSQNTDAIVKARLAALENVSESILAAILGKLETYIAQIRAVSVDTTGVESYLSEMDLVYMELEAAAEVLVPRIPLVITDTLDSAQLLPDVDVLDLLLERSGLKAVLDQMKSVRPADESKKFDDLIAGIRDQVAAVKPEDVVVELSNALNTISASVAMAGENYTPARVEQMMDEIAKASGLAQDASKIENVEIKEVV